MLAAARAVRDYVEKYLAKHCRNLHQEAQERGIPMEDLIRELNHEAKGEGFKVYFLGCKADPGFQKGFKSVTNETPGVYVLYTLSGACYVGMGNSIFRRVSEHLRPSIILKGPTLLYQYLREHGKNAIYVAALTFPVGSSQEDVKAYETRLINTLPSTLNTDRSGAGLAAKSPEAIASMQEARGTKVYVVDTQTGALCTIYPSMQNICALTGLAIKTVMYGIKEGVVFLGHYALYPTLPGSAVVGSEMLPADFAGVWKEEVANKGILFGRPGAPLPVYAINAEDPSLSGYFPSATAWERQHGILGSHAAVAARVKSGSIKVYHKV